MPIFEITSIDLSNVTGGAGDIEPYPRLDPEQRPGKLPPQSGTPPFNPPPPRPSPRPWEPLVRGFTSTVQPIIDKMSGVLQR